MSIMVTDYLSLMEVCMHNEENTRHHYRKGMSGDWKNYFSNAHINSTKKLIGNALIELGYEKNNFW
jgi:hypothetical protein